jgi:hypothetical protein
MFLIIIAAIFCLQALLLSFAGFAFGVYPHFGLTIPQWGLCILIGSFSLIASIILKLLPFAKPNHEHTTTEKGFGNKMADVRKGSRVISLKRIDERVDRDLAKNHVLA